MFAHWIQAKEARDVSHGTKGENEEEEEEVWYRLTKSAYNGLMILMKSLK